MLGFPDDPDIVAIKMPLGVALVGPCGNWRLSRLPRMDNHSAADALSDVIRHDDAVGQTDVWVIPKLRRLLERCHEPVQPFLPAAQGLARALDSGLRHGSMIAVRMTSFPVGPLRPDAKIDATHLPPETLARIRLLLERTPQYLSKDLAAAFAKLVTVEALAGIAAAFAVLLAAQFFGVGEVADAALAWWAYTQAGFSGVYGLYEAMRAVVTAVRAKDDATFDRAVRQFADGLAAVGVALLTVVVTRAVRRQRSFGDGESSSSSTPAPNGKPVRSQPPVRSAPPPSKAGGFADNDKLLDHFSRHGSDFGATSPSEYQQQANTFLNGTRGPNVLEQTRANGDLVRFDPTSQEFGVVKPDGTIRTYFMPDPAVHGFPTNLDYFNDQ